jgi:hypothetical protein
MASDGVLQAWSPGISKISQTNRLSSPLKKFDNLRYPCVAFVEPPWLEEIYFQNCMYMRDVFRNAKQHVM